MSYNTQWKTHYGRNIRKLKTTDSLKQALTKFTALSRVAACADACDVINGIDTGAAIATRRCRHKASIDICTNISTRVITKFRASAKSNNTRDWQDSYIVQALPVSQN